MSTDEERTVQIGGVAEDRAAGMLHTEGQMTAGTEEDIRRAVPDFTEIELPTFKAKWAVVNGDLQVQFYLPAGAPDLKRAGANEQRRWEAYWLKQFPNALSPVAKKYFQADKPRLVAKYTDEVASWWFCARGFGEAVSPSALAEGFAAALDAELQASTESN